MAKKRWLCLILFGMLLPACAPTEKESVELTGTEALVESLNVKNPKELPEHIELEVSEDIAINADVRTWELEKYELADYYVTMKSYSEPEDESLELVQKLLAVVGREEAFEQIEFEAESSIYRVHLNTEIGSGLGVAPYSASVMTDEYLKNVCYSTFDTSYGPLNTRQLFRTGKEFSFGSIEDGGDEARALLEELGCEVCQEYDCYTLDEANVLIEPNLSIYASTNFYDEDEVEGAHVDDCYVYMFFHDLNGIPYSRAVPDAEVTNNIVFENQYIVCKSEQGILGVDLSARFEVEQEGEVQEILLPGNLLEQQISRLSQITLNGPVILTEISLEYLPVTEDDEDVYHAVPVWVFYYTQHQTYRGEVTYESDDTYSTMYNAFTGELLRSS